jgi:hypothetical protein
MGQGFLYRSLPPQGRNDFLRSLPKEKASDLRRVTPARLEGSAETLMENKSKGRLPDEGLHDLARKDHASRSFHVDMDGNVMGPISPEGGTHPAPDNRPPYHLG